MSRIDQALRLWETDHLGTAADTAPSHSGMAVPLHQYPQEDPSRLSREEPLSLRRLDSEHVEPPVATSSRTHPSGTSLNNPDTEARLVTTTSNNVSLEHYRRLGAVLLEEQIHKQLKTVMVTSAVPREGKTLTVVNLALTLAESYARRVLIIDGDLRAPSVHRLLNVPNDRGLSEALTDGHTELRPIEVSSHLSVLPAGQPGPRPLAGLTSKRMEEVIALCAARFDWVLIDTSPVGVLTDAQVLARLVGAVIFVIGTGSTPAAAVERAVAELGPDSIIGMVLNRVEDRFIPHTDYYEEYTSARRDR